jgi:hypothetical protein
MSDLSVRPKNDGALRAADALLRALGGCQVMLRMPGAAAASVDGEQLGLSQPTFVDLPLGPAIIRDARLVMTTAPAKFELLLSASAVQSQVSARGLGSADVLFAMATGFLIGGEFFLIESTSFTESMGNACLYRVLLREAQLQSC